MLRTSESMSKISPKLIDVEGNRVDFISEDDINSVGWFKNKKELKYDDTYLDGKGIYGGGSGLGIPKVNKNLDGRFPTQLFTNNKKEQYKYVKHIS